MAPVGRSRTLWLLAVTVAALLLVSGQWSGAGADEPPPPSGDVEELLDLTDQGETVRVIVEVSNDAAQDAVARETDTLGGRVVHQYENFSMLALEVDATALQGLVDSSDVLTIKKDVADKPHLGTSLGVIHAFEVHNAGWDGSGTVVAILDTGIDAAHPFFTGRVVHEACFSSGGDQSLCADGNTSQIAAGSASINGLACQDGSDNICDHGQHVAGIAAGDGTGIVGAPPAGVAPGAGIIAIQVFSRFDDDADCGGEPGDAPCVLSNASDQIAALDHVLNLKVNEGHNVVSVNMSLGGGEFEDNCDVAESDRKNAIDALRAENIATVISSGNDGFDNAVGAPGCISTAITVGATTNEDAVTRNRGPLLELFAPGQDINSSVEDDGFGIKSGTSMAAPHVTGAWAVIRQLSPNMSVTDVLTLLQDTGVPITYQSGESTVTTPRLDLLRAAATFDLIPPTVTLIPEQLLPNGQWVPYPGFNADPPWVNHLVRVRVVCEDDADGFGIAVAPMRLLYSEEGDRELVIPAGEYGGSDNALGSCIDYGGNVADPTPQVITRVDRSSPSCTVKPFSSRFAPDGTFQTVHYKIKPNDPYFGKVGVSVSLKSATGNDGAKPNHVQVISNKEIRFKAMTKSLATRTYQVVWEVTDRAGNTGTCSAKVLIR